MSDPLFVMTSEGHLNLAKIVHISLPRDGRIKFYFGGPYTVSLPQEEGRKIISWLKGNRPEWLLGD
jgi:hypothetical protein